MQVKRLADEKHKSIGVLQSLGDELKQKIFTLLLGIHNIITKSRQFSNSRNGAKNAKPIPHTT